MDFLLTLIIGAVAGIGIYYFDLKRGRRWYTKWYNMTHEHPMQIPNNKGFVHQQTARGKVVTAAVVTIVALLIAFVSGGFHPLTDLVLGIVVFLGLVVGFYIGAPILKLLPGGVELLKDLMDKADDLEKRLGKHEDQPVLDEQKVEPEKIKKPEAEEPKSEESKSQEKENDKGDWRKGVQDFLDK